MKVYHVISHTHWDREWYRPLAVMRRHLVGLMDNLLQVFEDEPSYIFHLDAQTICLEDYLDVRPHRRALLEKLVQERRLLVGPWYIQNDFFLTSGEATVRNLLIGRRMANAFGHCDTIGYAPDQFGLIGQLPQILLGFGIDNCVFARGYDSHSGGVDRVPQTNEFRWASPDGSEVLGIYLSAWYNNAQRFSADIGKATKYLKRAGDEIAHRSLTPHLLMMNGVDHLEAQEDLLPILEKLKQQMPDGESVGQSTLTRYMASVREYLEAHSVPLRRLSGEMRYGEGLLQGTLSGWTPIKRRNVEAQALLELQLEPESIIASVLTGMRPDLDYQRFLWKKLIENHPHDTICACSNDRVQEDAINRLDNVITGAVDAIHHTRRSLMEYLDRSELKGDEYLIAVFNSLPFDRAELISATFFFPGDEDISKIRLIDPEGRDVLFEVVGSVRRRRATFSPINLPGMIEGVEVDVLLLTSRVPACGFCIYRVIPNEGTHLQLGAEPAVIETLENDFLKVCVSKRGVVDLFDKVSGIFYSDIVGFTDETDIGSAYNFRRPGDGAVTPLEAVARCEVRPVESSQLRPSVAVEYVFERAKHYDLSVECGGSELVTNRVTVIYSLAAGARHLDMEMVVENRSEHHRVRLVVRSGISSAVTTASSPFDYVDRKCIDLDENSPSSRDQPNSGVVSVRDDERQLTIFNRGLFEYEHGENGNIALTLLRSFTTINEIENVGEPEKFFKESVDFSCPRSAMMGDYRLSAAVRPGLLSRAAMENEFHAFLSPLSAVFDSADHHKFCGGRPCVQDTSLQELFFRELPPERKVLSLEMGVLSVNTNVVVSAIKPSEDGVGYILRVYNPEIEAVKAAISFSQVPVEAWCVSLDEERNLLPLPLQGNLLELNVCSHGIQTVKVVTSPGAG